MARPRRLPPPRARARSPCAGATTGAARAWLFLTFLRAVAPSGIAARVIALPHLRCSHCRRQAIPGSASRDRCTRGSEVRIGSRTRPRARATACSQRPQASPVERLCDRHCMNFVVKHPAARGVLAPAAPLIRVAQSTNPHEATKCLHMPVLKAAPSSRAWEETAKVQALILEAAREQGVYHNQLPLPLRTTVDGLLTTSQRTTP